LLAACQTQTPKVETAKPAADNPPATPAATAAPAVTPAPATAGTVSAAGEIIIDNHDPGFKSVGAWSPGDGSQDYKAQVIYATGTGPAETPATATWTPDIKVAGQFDVYEWHGTDPNSDHATNAPFTINYDGGSKTVPVDLRANTGRWNLLGTFKFAAGKSGNVTLSSKAGGNVIANAVRFVPHNN